jgi:hypothetical protein
MSRTYSDAVRMIERDWARRGISSRGAGLHTLGQLQDLGISPRAHFPDGAPATFNTDLVHGPELDEPCVCATVRVTTPGSPCPAADECAAL